MKDGLLDLQDDNVTSLILRFMEVAVPSLIDDSSTCEKLADTAWKVGCACAEKVLSEIVKAEADKDE